MSEMKISVIMGIYNCAATLPEALDCLLQQSYPCHEIVLCDDGSTDDTWQVACSYQYRFPDLFVLLRNERNFGLNHTLNRCLAAATGDLIARMDGDDRCDPKRFETEVLALAEDPALSFVSTDMQFFDESGVWGCVSHSEFPSKTDFLHGSPYCHAPCMVRREAYEAVEGYTEDPRLLRVEDYHLWIKMTKLGLRGRNIHVPLYQMRDDRAAYNRRAFRYRLNESYVMRLAVRELKLPAYDYIYSLRPILVGLLPKFVYDALHKRRLRMQNDRK